MGDCQIIKAASGDAAFLSVKVFKVGFGSGLSCDRNAAVEALYIFFRQGIEDYMVVGLNQLVVFI